MIPLIIAALEGAAALIAETVAAVGTGVLAKTAVTTAIKVRTGGLATNAAIKTGATVLEAAERVPNSVSPSSKDVKWEEIQNAALRQLIGGEKRECQKRKLNKKEAIRIYVGKEYRELLQKGVRKSEIIEKIFKGKE
jgi:hypothetical protein